MYEKVKWISTGTAVLCAGLLLCACAASAAGFSTGGRK